MERRRARRADLPWERRQCRETADQTHRAADQGLTVHAKARLTRRELRYLTEIDYEDHFAWCAFIVDDSGTSAMGVARYICVAPRSDHAEVAIEIVDQYQGRGLGTTLMEILAETAMEHGVNTFIAYVSRSTGP